MTKYFTKDGDEYKEVEDNLLAQADVDSVVEKRLERERSKFADYDAIKEKANSVETVKQEFETKLKAAGESHSELEKQLGAAKLETDKVKVISEFKLPTDLEEFVYGDTADEMRARAEKLAKGVKGGKVIIPKSGKPDEKETDSKKIAGKLFGNKSDD